MSRLPIILLGALAGALACSDRSWLETSDGPGGFTISFPASPKIETQVQPSLASSTTVHTALLERGSEGNLQVVWYDLPDAAAVPGLPPNLLAGADCNSAFSDTDLGFTSRSNGPVPVAGRDGVAYTGTAPSSSKHPRGMWEEDRCLVVGRRLYHLTAVGPDVDEMRATGRRFLGSFSLAPSAGR